MTITKKQKVWNYLLTGKGITRSVAKTRFGVENLRATISDLVNVENVKVTTQFDKRTNQTKYTLKAKA